MSEGIRAKTGHGEMTIDQLADIQPGMAELMQKVGDYYYYAYYAAKGGNWRLAAHELNLVRVMFRKAHVTRPKFREDLQAFDAEYLTPIFRAIQDQNWAKCEEVFEKGIEGSDVYHDKRGYPYIRFLMPKEPPRHLHLGPVEGFRRAKGEPTKAQ